MDVFRRGAGDSCDIFGMALMNQARDYVSVAEEEEAVSDRHKTKVRVVSDAGSFRLSQIQSFHETDASLIGCVLLSPHLPCSVGRLPGTLILLLIGSTRTPSVCAIDYGAF